MFVDYVQPEISDSHKCAHCAPETRQWCRNGKLILFQANVSVINIYTCCCAINTAHTAQHTITNWCGNWKPTSLALICTIKRNSIFQNNGLLECACLGWHPQFRMHRPNKPVKWVNYEWMAKLWICFSEIYQWHLGNGEGNGNGKWVKGSKYLACLSCHLNNHCNTLRTNERSLDARASADKIFQFAII